MLPPDVTHCQGRIVKAKIDQRHDEVKIDSWELRYKDDPIGLHESRLDDDLPNRVYETINGRMKAAVKGRLQDLKDVDWKATNWAELNPVPLTVRYTCDSCVLSWRGKVRRFAV